MIIEKKKNSDYFCLNNNFISIKIFKIINGDFSRAHRIFDQLVP